MITAIVGINWGDEGKGRMVDLLSGDYDVVARYQGGNNAGHTVVTDAGKFVMNLLPCGILRDNTVNVLGTGMALDLEHLKNEIDGLRLRGVKLTPENVKVSEKAVISMPYHRLLDEAEEDRLGKDAQGSTRRGIAPVYSDKFARKAIRVGDLKNRSALIEKLEPVIGYVNIRLRGYGKPEITMDSVLSWLDEFGGAVMPFTVNTEDYMENAAASGKNILLEAQLGTLRDMDFGIYPYTTSSNTLAAYAAIGAGIPGRRVDRVIGVMKSYSSSVGGGPFTVEMQGDEAHKLREAGGEYGAATGRPRRVGAFDVVASRFGVRMQGADELALTLFDVLGYMETIPVCFAYDIDGEITREFPVGERLERAKPVFEYLPGFKTDITKCRSFSALPKEAADYVRFIEKEVACPVKYITVGPHRDDYIQL